MFRRGMLLLVLQICIIATVGASLFLYNQTAADVEFNVTTPSLSQIINPLATETLPMHIIATTTIWFGGDVMLSRQAGHVAMREGRDHSWQYLKTILASDDTPTPFFFINFEGCVSTTTVFNKAAPMRFPVSPSVTPGLTEAGVTHLSLANNHAMDCGVSDFRQMRRHFTSENITSFGHPSEVSSSSVTYLGAGYGTLAIIALHTLYRQPTETELRDLIEEVRTKSDMQIVYIHWGEEYNLLSNPSEKSLAQTLSILGVDIVIGHHPHVVQELALIDSTLVAYSLGNLIFDQYFSTEVQEGLLLKLELGQSAQISLVPITSQFSRLKPRTMDNRETAAFLAELSARSDRNLSLHIEQGVIPLDAILATSTKKAIMDR